MHPLVAPGPPLSPAEALRYSRHTVLPGLGDAGQRRLRNARVCVVGAGGLGSPALLYLAAAGVGRLGIIDRDDVEVTNLQRQVVHATRDVGRRKVASARESVLAIDPGVVVDEHDLTITPRTARDVLAGYDLVLDGTDNFPTRYVVNDACADLGLPLVWGSVLGFDAQVSVFWSAAPGGVGVDLRDLFPEPPDPRDVPSCADAGVVGALCGQVGSLMALEAIKMVAGVGDPLLGRILVIDAFTARTREIPLRRAGGARRASATAADVAASGPACPAPAAPPPDRAGRSAPEPPVGVTAAELAARLRAGGDLAVIDVREPPEHVAGAIPCARLVPLADLRSGAGLAALPLGVPLVLYCASGVRSAEAVRLVRDAGYADAVHLSGGILAWWAHLDAEGSADAGAAPARARVP